MERFSAEKHPQPAHYTKSHPLLWISGQLSDSWDRHCLLGCSACCAADIESITSSPDLQYNICWLTAIPAFLNREHTHTYTHRHTHTNTHTDRRGCGSQGCNQLGCASVKWFNVQVFPYGFCYPLFHGEDRANIPFGPGREVVCTPSIGRSVLALETGCSGVVFV